MSLEAKQYSKNDLEHAKFTPDSTKDNSIVQVAETNTVLLQNSITKLDCIIQELQKLNTYMAIITNERL